MVPQEEALKVVLVGDGGIGKSTLYRRLESMSSEKFEPKYIPTIGVMMTVTHLPNKLTLRLFDPAGSERFGRMRDGFFIGSEAAILVFDCTARITLKNLVGWRQDMRRLCPNAVVVVCANKIDSQPKIRPRDVARTLRRVCNAQTHMNKRAAKAAVCAALIFRSVLGRDLANLIGRTVWKTRTHARSWSRLSDFPFCAISARNGKNVNRMLDVLQRELARKKASDAHDFNVDENYDDDDEFVRQVKESLMNLPCESDDEL